MPKYLVSHYVVINLEEKNHLLDNDNLSIFRSLFRNDGIIIAISIWQVIVESISTVIFMITNRQQPMNQQHKIILLVLFQLSITFIVLPSFYLLADNRFRLALKDKGFFRSIWSALKQKYEK